MVPLPDGQPSQLPQLPPLHPPKGRSWAGASCASCRSIPNWWETLVPSLDGPAPAPAACGSPGQVPRPSPCATEQLTLRPGAGDLRLMAQIFSPVAARYLRRRASRSRFTYRLLSLLFHPPEVYLPWSPAPTSTTPIELLAAQVECENITLPTGSRVFQPRPCRHRHLRRQTGHRGTGGREGGEDLLPPRRALQLPRHRLAREAHRSDALARTPVEMLRLDRLSFLNLLHHHPTLALLLIGQQHNRLREQRSSGTCCLLSEEAGPADPGAGAAAGCAPPWPPAPRSRRWGSSWGASSTTSAATRWWWRSSSTRAAKSPQWKPPGSGVPVPGSTAGSNQSRSTVR